MRGVPFVKPLTPRECADYMGCTTEWIRRAVNDGVTVKTAKGKRAVVRLEAETIAVNGRRMYRVHVDHFSDFLQAIGWKHLPKRSPSTNGSTGTESTT